MVLMGEETRGLITEARRCQPPVQIKFAAMG